MRVIIDTNIYLNFYQLSDQSLVLLDSLIEIIKDKKISLILPQQIRDEFLRNTNKVTNKVQSEMKSALRSTDFSIPAFLISYKRVKELRSLSKKSNKILKEILLEYEKRTVNPKSKINLKINQVFKLATPAKDSKDILDKAYYRTLRGNPPRKGNKSFGDAIIWETVLEMYSDEDLIIISNDGDFEDETKKIKIHSFLLKEFKEKNGKNIEVYRNLADLIKRFGKRKVAKEVIEEEAQLNRLFSIAPITTNWGESSLTIQSRLGALSDQSLVASPGSRLKFTSSPTGRMSLGSRYEIASDGRIVQPKTCSRCGKAYHELLTSLTLGPDLCPTCQGFVGYL